MMDAKTEKSEMSLAADDAVSRLIEKHGALFVEGEEGALRALLCCAFFDGAKWMSDAVSKQIMQGVS